MFVVFTSSNTFNAHEAFENVTEVTMMDEAQILHIGEIVAQIAGANHDAEEVLSLDSMWRFGVGGGKETLEGWVDDAAGGFDVGEIEVADKQFIGFDDERFNERVASETVRNAFAVVIELAIEFEDEIIEFGERGFGDDGRGDAFDIAMRAVAQLFDLFFGVNLR